MVKTFLASATLVAVAGAQAQVSGATVAPGPGPFLTLTVTGLAASGTFAGATFAGGTVFGSDQSFADMPKGAGSMTVGNFLAAGPAANSPATLAFTTPVENIGFLWGSPDLYNLLTVTTTIGTQAFVAGPSLANPGATSLGFTEVTGNQDFSQYVQLVAQGGSSILSLRFENVPSIDAFEASNFSVAAIPEPGTRGPIVPIPEPGTYALILAGLGGFGLIAVRRRIRR